MATAGWWFGVLCSLSVLLIAHVWYNSFELEEKVPFDVSNVLAGLLAVEAEASVRPGAQVAIGFGGCLDRLGNGIDVLNHLGASPPSSGENFNELNNLEELEKAFGYYFQRGASAGRTTTNGSFFSEVEKAMVSIPNVRTAVGGNAPVMAKRFIEEGVDVVLGAQISPSLQSQLDPKIRVIGQNISVQDTHLIFEYERGDSWGSYAAPRANRFIFYNTVGHAQFTSLFEDFNRELIHSKPPLVVVGGLRMMLGVDSHHAGDGPGLLDRLSMMLKALRSTTHTLVHVEMSSFPEKRQLARIVDQVVRHADSIGLNEQELPRLRRHLDGDRSSDDSPSEDSNPTVADVVNDVRSVFNLLRQLARHGQRSFSRLHLHTLGFHVLAADASVWPNGRAAIAKAALTSNRHTCGSRDVDVDRARLILGELVEIQSADNERLQLRLDSRSPVACWTERSRDYMKAAIEMCIAPVLVCKNVVQTVGGGDNVSAAGLVLQI